MWDFIFYEISFSNPLSVTLQKVGERIPHWGVPASVLYSAPFSILIFVQE
jgi:hypothetical protein